MPTALKDFITESNKKYGKVSAGEMRDLHFLRDPSRPQYLDRDYFFSPADGVIVNQGMTKHGEIVNVKGAEVTLKDLLMKSDFTGEAFVIGIFLTYLDVHVIRSPAGGTLSYKPLDPLHSANIPMLFEERDLLLRHKIVPGDRQYLFTNQRMRLDIFNPEWDYRFYVVLVADSDIDKIAMFSTEQKRTVEQNESIAQVRRGSEALLILPVDKRLKFTPLCNVGEHVEGRNDTLVNVEMVR